MTKRLAFCWLLLAFMCLPVLAQMQDPIKFKTEWKKISDTEAEIIFNASIEKGWHLYSTELGDGGPISTSFNVDKIEGAEIIGKLTPQGTEIDRWVSSAMDYPTNDRAVKAVDKIASTRWEITFDSKYQVVDIDD